MSGFKLSLLNSFDKIIRTEKRVYDINNSSIAFRFPIVGSMIEIPLFFRSDVNTIIERINNINNIKSITYPLPNIKYSFTRKTFKGAYNCRPDSIEEIYKILVGTELYYFGSSFILDKDFNLLMCLTVSIDKYECIPSDSVYNLIPAIPKCYIDYSVLHNSTLVNKGILNSIIKTFSSNDIIYSTIFKLKSRKVKIIIDDLNSVVVRAAKPLNIDMDKDINSFLSNNIETVLSNPNFYYDYRRIL